MVLIRKYYRASGLNQMDQLVRLIIWNNLGFSNIFFLSGKPCLSKGQEDLCLLLGFWDHFLITFTGNTSS